MGHYDEQREKEAKNPICNHCKRDYTDNKLEIICMDENGNCQMCRAELSGKFCTSVENQNNIAASILQDAIDAMSERGKSYDTDGKGVERSMDKVVAMFNTLTGHTLTTEQGWDFMILLKLVRASQGYKHDNYIDGSAYFGLAGEAASEAADD